LHGVWTGSLRWKTAGLLRVEFPEKLPLSVAEDGDISPSRGEIRAKFKELRVSSKV
jgi:hypothetical protein